MAKAGCKYIFLGVETASESMINKMNVQKVRDLEKFKQILKLLYRYGIKTHNFFMVEFPYESYEDFKKTIDFIKKTSKYATTVEAGIFSLLDNSPVFLSPKSFKIKIRNKNTGKYCFLDKNVHFFYTGAWRFDEIDGLKWEEKHKRGKIKEKMLNTIIFRKVALRRVLKSLFKTPLYAIKKKILYPYSCYDEYFLY